MAASLTEARAGGYVMNGVSNARVTARHGLLCCALHFRVFRFVHLRKPPGRERNPHRIASGHPAIRGASFIEAPRRTSGAFPPVGQ
ncbi:hypothetical protein [Burkholderia stabilis]|uniref:hypothetical protein n=1 Tax=Burkholderia stabilis TaxID=95485 RepID=UPI0013CF1197|nr:hypothetical protein [Burkholderia stabilis]